MHLAFERGGEDVNAFVHTVAAGSLRAEQSARPGVEQNLQRNGLCAREVACMRLRVKMDDLVVDLQSPCGFFIQAGGAGSDVKDANDG